MVWLRITSFLNGFHFSFIFLVVFNGITSYSQEIQSNKKYPSFVFVNRLGCEVRFNCSDSLISNNELNQLISLLNNIGSKDRGLENEFKTYRTYDFKKENIERKYLIQYSSEAIGDFENSISKLQKHPVPAKLEVFKNEILSVYLKMFEFEKIFNEWYIDGNDSLFVKNINSKYSNINFIQATLDRNLALKSQEEKWKYTYVELYDLASSHVFPNTKILQLQNKILFDNKIDIFIDPNCKK